MSAHAGTLDAAALRAAYAACERVASAHYENFPVASRLAPRHMRPHLAAVYAFARSADDIADEGEHLPQQRFERLDRWAERLHACVDEDPGDDLFRALGATIRACALPMALFDDLISAFRQDITTTRYDTWADVFDYCRRSANPVGRIVLRIAGHDEPRLDRSSDGLCTALQLTNFWQDLAIDWRRGRLYVPLEVVTREGANLDDLEAARWTDAWRRVMRAAGDETRRLFAEGRDVCDAVGGRLRFELRATWLGGGRILDRLERADFDVFAGRPSLGARDAALILGRTLLWRRP